MTTTDFDYLGLPEYEVVSELGRGGFGEVLLARHRILGRLVAVKHIPARVLGDPEALARFGREALALARVAHPAVVAVYDLRITERSAVLLMEYVPGESLRQALDGRVIPAPVAIGILDDVAIALDAAAAVGIVHRDVKPANVFLLSGGRAKLGDFGIARIADAGIFRTQDGVLTGTPAYMAPETMQPEHVPDSRADDYAFAVMAYEMLLGRLPFLGEGLSLLGQHGFVTPASPEQVLPGFPPAAAAALLGGLEKDPARRLTARALVDRLEAVPPEAWPPPPPPVGTAQPVASTVLGVAPPRLRSPVSPPPAPRPHGRRRTSLVLGAVVVLGLVGTGVFVVSTRGDDTLSIVGATVSVDTVDGSCPSARYVFTALIDTNGAPGEVRLRWLQPDGERTSSTVIDVREGQDPVTATLQFDVSGGEALRGAATLEVLAPQASTATPVDIGYACP